MNAMRKAISVGPAKIGKYFLSYFSLGTPARIRALPPGRGASGRIGALRPRPGAGRSPVRDQADFSDFHVLTKYSLTALQSSLPEAYWARWEPSWFLNSWLGKVWKTQLIG